jgi:hypothetical protein
MNMLRELIGGVVKMFVGDAWLAAGVLAVVLLIGVLVGSRRRTAADR